MSHINLKSIEKILMILIGNLLYSLAVAFFILPSGLITGGTTGIALFVNYLTGFDISLFVLIFNIVMFIVGFLILGKTFALSTALSSICYPFMLSLGQRLNLLMGDLTHDLILCTVFGGIGLGFSGLGLLVQLLLAAFQAASLSAAILPGVLSLVFLEMISYGNGQRRRLKRAEKYLELCGTKMYGVINEMARYTGKSVRYVRRDLRKMLKAGMFPDGHLDDKETCFMLNDVIYRQYLETEKAYLEQKKISEQEKEQNTADTDTQDTEQNRREQELHSIVAEGMEYIRHLRDLNDRIEGEAISEKLYQLENLLKEIFDRVQEHPEQMHRMHKLMDYYLPTMLKLVEQYAEFDEISSPGDDILDAKKEIEKTLDMINQAFVTLLNNLFRDAAFDASADAQVLQTMLAKEGLTESDFVREKSV